MYLLWLATHTIPAARMTLTISRPPAASCQFRFPSTRSAYRSSHARQLSAYVFAAIALPLLLTCPASVLLAAAERRLALALFAGFLFRLGFLDRPHEHRPRRLALLDRQPRQLLGHLRWHRARGQVQHVTIDPQRPRELFDQVRPRVRVMSGLDVRQIRLRDRPRVFLRHNSLRDLLLRQLQFLALAAHHCSKIVRKRAPLHNSPGGPFVRPY